MSERKKIVFKVNDEIILEQSILALTDLKIEEMKWLVASEIQCSYYDVEVEIIDTPQELSNVDVTTDGFYDWRDCTGDYITKVICSLKEGSDEYLDAMADGTILDYIELC